MAVDVRPIDGANFREALELQVRKEQSAWVTSTARYLALCAYGGTWRPLGLYADGAMVGFAMWARDPEDGSHWIGGFLVDRSQQGRGYGRAALQSILDYLRAEQEPPTLRSATPRTTRSRGVSMRRSASTRPARRRARSWSPGSVAQGKA